MEEIINSIGISTIIFILLIINVITLIGLFTCIFKISGMKKKYKNFMIKIGNGKNIEEDLENYMYRVERVERRNAEIDEYLKIMNKDLSKCIQKVGIVRYNAFKDTGSDLSFALALLDENNDGVVLNGIYSREISNIYAKPVESGKSNYTISEQEQEAINKAIESQGVYKIR